MVTLLARLRYALRRHGPIGIVWLAGYNIRYLLRRGRDTSRPANADAFDEVNGTDTGGVREIGTLDVVNSAAARYAVRYDPSSAELVRAQLARIRIDYTRFTFIDFGSGKGRVLLVAAELPFKEVIGIEFSRELHEVAHQNIRRLSPDKTRAGSVRSINCEASVFEPPQSDLVCYFYNPFGPPVLEAVAARLAALHERQGFRVIVIYSDPRHAEAFQNSGKFLLLDRTPDAVILTTSPTL